MTKSLSELTRQAKEDISNCSSLKELDSVRVFYLGKKGKVSLELKSLSKLDPKERPKFGKQINKIKKTLQEKISLKKTDLNNQKIKASIEEAAIDITLPGKTSFIGNIHPLSTTLNEIEKIFINAGFLVDDGPEIEDEYHNFTALNIPGNHPARAMHDTFYFDNEYLLRTHTSPIQIRSMERDGVPIRVIAPGKVYRRDSDITHTPMFHQVEGLVIDKDINFTHLKGILHDFINSFFKDEMTLRFRPSYFPFTEPSAEVDLLSGDGQWLEILGCGMVHPKVLDNLGIDNKTFSGYAFGMGVERLTMLKYGIKDIRLFYENDLSFLSQFK
ncbi:MAG: phenylalanine--tRNA ligase alpha subunit [Woeseia sp.]|jgi:phenylalanyl-tRNA synthetase alpha chain|nr:MAG: phenylalanine--tRNA ligase alpha subunit [Woeseia sp.]